ncbi:glycosyltransferase family 2 protein [Kribbella ginsengisoli]|uniref:Glycosyltransferase 2-like domain-containing protein n=1 Tax=Kribbella ginsengisoli TaxID=363865 RepID=A0ABP6XZ26_9ACTN
MTPRLSVVVPFYNVGEYIGDCLESIARQTFADFEAILVDDGSPDDSAAIAKDFCERDARFRIVEQHNQGLGPARNTGVREAQGDYLTFVDSDDLVSRHGFEWLIRTLDETGSCLAGGNARRFNNSAGVRPSWIHRLPFAKDRIATHVIETPDLILDRMIWNKVYRRSFWDEHGYEFPAIRYEDYPVTLQAHLDAVTVDAIAAPVYYWRERESGESITQQKFQFGNLADRVTSAELVLDLIDSGGPGLGEIRRRVHSHFTQIDMLTLMMAFGAVPESEEQELVLLASRFLERLDRSVLTRAHGYDRLQHAALRAGDVELLRRLAHFRNEGGLRGGARALPKPGRRRQFEHNYPGVHEANTAIPRSLYQLPARELTLATTVQDVAWRDGGLAIKGTAEIRHLATDAASSAVRIALVVDGAETPLAVRRFEATDSHGDTAMVGFEVHLDKPLLARLSETGAPGHFAVRMRAGKARREGKLRGQKAGSPGWPPGNWICANSWVQPGPGADGAFVLRRMVDPCRLTSVDQFEDALVLRGRVPAALDNPQLQLTRPLSGQDQVLSVELSSDRRFSVRIPYAPIIAETNPDDPFTQRTTWAFRMVGSDGTEKLLLWTAEDQAVNHLEQGRLVSLTRSTGGYVNLHEGPARLVAERALIVAESNELRISGPLTDVTHSFSWRRYIDDSDDHLDVACRSALSDGQWTASVKLPALVPENPVAHAVDPLASLADWVLFAVAADGSAQAVQCEPFLASRLPLVIEQNGHMLGVRPHAGTLHVEVR